MPHPFAGILLSAAIWLCICAMGAAQESDIASYAKWSTIELKFNGPDSQARGTPNPFAIPFDVIFTAPSGHTFRVPGFYDGDGSGAPHGKVWKVRFAADELGTWSWRSQSTATQLDGAGGRFGVRAAADNAPGFWKWGRLEYTGTPANGIRYLKFRDGPYWLKAGCDDPENFLGAFRHFNTPAKRRAAVDYLAQRGINSLYIMTHNLDGDHNDVWPWLGQTPEQAKSHGGANARFNIAKLQQWRQLFEYMQTKGVVPYLILEDDSGWKHYDHARYYREILARFGDLPAVVFNLGEEHNENYPLAESLALAQRFKALDPYNHPLGIHIARRAHNAYIDSPHLDLTSIQTGKPGEPRGLEHAVEHNQIAIDWIERSRSRGQRVPVINFDEGRPELDRRAWWSAYIGGGVWEAHVVEPYDQPLSAWESTWTQLGGTRAFMESLPFHAMQPRNDLIKSGTGLCLAREGRAYAVYLPQGGAIEIDLPRGALYESAWWNPDNGFDGKFQHQQLVTGGRRSFKAPSQGDWALRIVRDPDQIRQREGWRRTVDPQTVLKYVDIMPTSLLLSIPAEFDTRVPQ